ncbi:exodeoxyribonuclease VII large subunit [Crocinitomix catalasitica]|uniref:exodeoxyribonuclease VII large subunit n=1 Tax=Crocinitomix catalasitica TaxID=184607 RepID=UPI0009078D21|nr:exodeoxyribonuclease VII large subunit [Crocinitomix catalasitica]
MDTPKNIFSLTALTRSIERLVQNQLGDRLFWIVAEVVKIQEKNGHNYLHLVDSEEGKTTAEMDATLWFTTFNRINTKLNNELPGILAKGNKVLLQVKVEFHAVFGMKLNVFDVDPSITYGEIEKLKKETLDRLQKEGLLYLQKQLYLPPMIKKIGIIGSPNSSGYRDFINELFENQIFSNFKVKGFPTRVQGEKAENEIVKAILKAQAYNLDVLVIIRGGGSKMDLNLFNHYNIAKAISESKIPVITGIGHESDDVLSDHVAHISQITPTAVAKFIYLRVGIFKTSVDDAFNKIVSNSERLVSQKKELFKQLSNYIVFYAQETLVVNRNLLRENIHLLHVLSNERFEIERSSLRMKLTKIGHYAINKIELKKNTELFSTMDKIDILTSNTLRQNHVKLDNLNTLLELLNPEELLKKGYTISTINKVDINKFTGELIGSEMKTLTANKVIVSEITKVK